MPELIDPASELGRQLLRQGLPRQYVARVVREFDEHREDLERKARVSGLSLEGTRSAAREKMGDLEEVAKALSATKRRSYWWEASSGFSPSQDQHGSPLGESRKSADLEGRVHILSKQLIQSSWRVKPECGKKKRRNRLNDSDCAAQELSSASVGIQPPVADARLRRAGTMPLEVPLPLLGLFSGKPPEPTVPRWHQGEVQHRACRRTKPAHHEAGLLSFRKRPLFLRNRAAT